MKQLFLALLGMAALLFSGCASNDPIYYEELSEAETKELVNSARELALRSKAMPDHMRGVFVEMEPTSIRVNYDGDKHGKMSLRWEIYEPAKGKKLTQNDVNPYWVMVYAIGDFSNPEWKLSHAAQDNFKPNGAKPAPKKAKPAEDLPGYAAPPPKYRKK